MRIRIVLAATLAAALCFWTLDRPRAAAKELGIGSPAPALDIEHWIQTGNGFFKPVTKFEEGKVYVVEFWATWCGPCIASMPHLAELQNKYRGQNVQIVSVSDETLDEVKDLLAKENEQVGKTFAEITSAYSLTTDPDRSVHIDYMEAANQQGIPTSFLVGKSGLIEWIGHPMELDQPLEAVVNDSWDREAFMKEMQLQQAFEENMRKVAMLAGAEKFEEALKVVEAQKAASEGTPLNAQWNAIGYRLKLSAGMLDEQVMSYFREQFANMKGDAYSVGSLAFMILGEMRQGTDVGPLAKDALTAVEAELEGASEELKPLMYNTVALLRAETGDLKGAIEAQQAAIDAAPDERVKSRLMPLLEELKQKASETKPAADDK